MPRLSAIIIPLICTFAACSGTPGSVRPEGANGQIGGAPLPLTTDGTCFAKTAPREATRIVTRQIEVVPAVVAESGDVISPPVFRNETGPVREQVAPGARFATLCPDELTKERVATLQRALKARQAYGGPITGMYDTATAAAVQGFQAPRGIDSPELARSLAQRLGLIPFGSESTNAFLQ